MYFMGRRRVNHDDYFRFILQAVRQFAIYSPERAAWVISCLDAVVIFLEHQDKLPEGLNSFAEIVSEGRQRGLWDVVSDMATGLKFVVLRQRLPVTSA